MSVQHRILILVFVVVMLAGSVATIIARKVATTTIEDQVSDHLVTTLQSRSRDIQAAIDDKEESSKAISALVSALVEDTWSPDTETFQFNETYLGSILNMIKGSDEAVLDATILDMQGNVIASTVEEGDWEDDTLGMITSPEEGIYIGDIQREDDTGEYFLPMAVSVFIDQEPVGTLVLLNSVEDIFRITMDTIGLGKTGESYIINRDGYMITPSRFVPNAVLHQRVELEGSQISSSSPNPDASQVEYKADSYRNYSGTKVLGVHAEIPDLDWEVVVEKAASEAFSPVDDITKNMLWVLFGVFFVGIVGSFWLSRTITKPLVRLRNGVTEIMKGNLDYEVGILGADEIGELSRAFDEMTSKVRESREQLRQYNIGLEAMVEERTRELSAANEELSRQMAELEKAEEKIRASLKEKEVLLKEIHHRVKNNLQVISSLLYLQSKKVNDEQAYAMLAESQNRVRSMAFVHERLYRSGDLARIDFGEYVRDLVKYLLGTYGADSRRVQLKLDVDDVKLDVDKAIPCGLIINELISNSLKHAFPDNREGEIYLEFRSNAGHDYVLTVGDTGIGLPLGFDSNNTTSLGLQLVVTLVNQINGILNVRSNGGAEFSVHFGSGEDHEERERDDR